MNTKMKHECIGCGKNRAKEDGLCKECEDNYCTCGTELTGYNSWGGICKDCM